MERKSFYVEVLRPEISELLQKMAFDCGYRFLGRISTPEPDYLDNPYLEFTTTKSIYCPDIENICPSSVKFTIEQAIDYFNSMKVPEFKVGDWVITNGYSEDYDSIPLKIERIEEDSSGRRYYFFYKGHCNFIKRFIKRHATEDEIKEHLIAEAERRGFKAGVYYDATNLGYPTLVKELIGDGGFKYNKDCDELLLDNWEIYVDGEWAEIIPQENGFNLGTEIETMLTSLNKIRENMLTDQNS